MPARRSRRTVIVVGVTTVLGAFVAALIAILIVGRVTGNIKTFRLPGQGMAPTLVAGDAMAAVSPQWLGQDLSRGMIVTFDASGIEGIHAPEGQSLIFCQRVAALPGDEVRLESGRVLVNGVEFVTAGGAGPIHYEGGMGRFAAMGRPSFVVPESHAFMLGDNTRNSLDSRYWGLLPLDRIRHRVLWRYLPITRTGPVR